MERDPARLSVTITSTILLEGLKQPENRTAWQQFVGRYRPLVVHYAQNRFGLGVHDAEEAAQNTLAAFADAYQKGRYDREKGRLRKWLFGIATRQIRDLVRRRAKGREVQVADEGTGTGFLPRVADNDAELEEMWEEEWRRAVYQQCMVEIQTQFAPKTVAAFLLFAKEGQGAKEVAGKLGMTENAVCLAKYKILKRIRKLAPLVEENW